MALSDRNLLFHSSGNEKSEKKLFMGHIISENSNGVFPCFLLASGGFLAIFGIPCHVETSPWSLPSAERGLFLVCIWVPISPIYEDVRLD